jgi:flavin reductase (DIM6/NTAB) family NADH-FMN oxidoreductase RutF
MITVDPSSHTPNEIYSLLVSLVVPRPIALVSTLSGVGVPNLAPFSFFMVGGANPPSLMVSPVLGNHLDEKDTLSNVRQTGEFVVNLVDFSMRDGMNQASMPLNESEWEYAGFTPLPSETVKPARVAQSQVHLECRLFTVVEHGHGPVAARYIIGEILRFHFSERAAAGKFHPIARLGGPEYLDLDSMSQFGLERPTRIKPQ